ncbi:hypothetical protein GCM10023321_39510 [Pseudonocardia eucalypti]|uniref:J domain-containing protein n=2 Tax=Pseudonocardia eucalypti TaxID=648755 RepID=A0ABP9Q9G4_9PSEU
MLPVAPEATPQQINTAYRAAVRRLHPDTRPTIHDPATHDSTGDRATGQDREPTLAELQAARRELLRQAHQNRHARATRRRAATTTGTPRQRTQEPDQVTSPPAPTPLSRQHLRDRPHAGWPRDLDALAGPVRYHGPAP